MKTIHSNAVSSFGGLNFVIEEVMNLKIDKLLNKELPVLCSQSKYSWFDIYSRSLRIQFQATVR